jgi:hypothetical protein
MTAAELFDALDTESMLGGSGLAPRIACLRDLVLAEEVLRSNALRTRFTNAFLRLCFRAGYKAVRISELKVTAAPGSGSIPSPLTRAIEAMGLRTSPGLNTAVNNMTYLASFAGHGVPSSRGILQDGDYGEHGWCLDDQRRPR